MRWTARQPTETRCEKLEGGVRKASRQRFTHVIPRTSVSLWVLVCGISTRQVTFWRTGITLPRPLYCILPWTQPHQTHWHKTEHSSWAGDWEGLPEGHCTLSKRCHDPPSPRLPQCGDWWTLDQKSRSCARESRDAASTSHGAEY